MLHASLPTARDPRQLCPLAPWVPVCAEESSSPYLLSSGRLQESHLGSWLLHRGGREEGRGEGGGVSLGVSHNAPLQTA